LLSACGTSGKDSSQAASLSGELDVSAAASLQGALKEIEKDYKQKYPQVQITYNFASSGTLQRQIENGAPVDIFLSAGKSQMDELEKQNLLLDGSRLDLLGNELVLIAGKDSQDITELKDLAKPSVSQIGIGVPETVPAGKYAKEALVNLQMWEPLQEKYILAKDVKQVLTYVETGNVEAGFVYLSDAAGSDKVKIIESLPSDSHSPIVYPAAIIKEAKNRENAEAFLKYLQGADAQKILERHGFKTK
jgi:molybdate transport system substrate-binding protein